MASLWIRTPGCRPAPLGDANPRVRFGRASGNEVVIEDPSVSRHHAQLLWSEQGPVLEDLGSRNGCLVNGKRIEGPCPVAPGDHIQLGKVEIRMEATDPAPLLEGDPDPGNPHTSLRMRVEALRSIDTGPPIPEESRRWREALGIVHGLSLALMGNEPAELMLWDLLERLFAFLRPSHGAVLLKQPGGQLTQVAARSASGGGRFQLKLSTTMVEAALEHHEAMRVNHPLEDVRLRNAPSLIRSGIASVMTVPLEFEGEVAGLIYLDAGPGRGLFTDAELQLVACLGHLAAAKLQSTRLSEELARRRDLEKELGMARQIQARLLPDRMPELQGYACFGANIPCRQVSGDLYGHWPGPEGRLWLSIADVAGKGLGPGLLMATFQAYMQAWAEGCEAPADLALKLSQALSHRVTRNRFITAFLLCLDPLDHVLAYTNAGHNPALVLRAGGGAEWLPSQGFPLALFAGRPYAQAELRLAPGDLVCLYTDGISEATDPQGREFGEAGLEAVLRTHREAPLEAQYRALCAALDAHGQGAPLADDRTVLMIRRQD